MNESLKVSLVIPARNEEKNISKLLKSIQASEVKPFEVIVANDHSTDRTAELARSLGARVIENPALPPEWTGKTWGLWNGAQAATGDVLLFVDADCWFKPQGFSHLISVYKQCSKPIALSVLPYHEIESFYENGSYFFNIFMTLGSGLIPYLSKACDQRLCGPLLMMSRLEYLSVGGHTLVKSEILENFNLTKFLTGAGFRCTPLFGKNLLHFRMYPDGFKSLIEGWSKAFIVGAKGTSLRLLLFSILFTTLALGSATSFFLNWHWALPFYIFFSILFFFLAKKIGNFSWLASALFPLCFIFYFAVFLRSFLLSRKGKSVMWRGRKIAS